MRGPMLYTVADTNTPSLTQYHADIPIPSDAQPGDYVLQLICTFGFIRVSPCLQWCSFGGCIDHGVFECPRLHWPRLQLLPVRGRRAHRLELVLRVVANKQ